MLSCTDMDVSKAIINILNLPSCQTEKRFKDILICVQEALDYMGVPCTATENRCLDNALNLVIGSIGSTNAHVLEQAPGKAYVVLQTEALKEIGELRDSHPGYFELLKGASAIWDYSEVNIDLLRAQGLCRLVHLPIDIHPLHHEFSSSGRDIDILLWGSLTPRRVQVLQRLRREGLLVKASPSINHPELSSMFKRAKIVIQIHPSESVHLSEDVVALPLVNRCFVISEVPILNRYQGGIVFCPYEGIVDTCLRFLHGEEEHARTSIAQCGFKMFRKFHLAEKLKLVLNATSASETKPDHRDVWMEGYYRHERPEVLQMVPSDARRILDIGCGAGMVGKGLKARQSCEVTGLEIVPQAAALAAQVIDMVLCGDALVMTEGLPNEHYDTVIMADVLEHVDDTDRMLQLAWLKLKANGKLVLSIPNIRHWSVIKDLLEGHWDYQSAGILDKSHLRFFTLNSIHQALAANGFKVEQSSATIFGSGAPKAFVEAMEALGLDVADLESDSSHYQYLFVCGKHRAMTGGSGPRDNFRV